MIKVENAWFDGPVLLSNLTVPVPLALLCCRFADWVELVNSRVSDVSLDGSWLGPRTGTVAVKRRPALMAEGLRAGGFVSLRDGFAAFGAVRLLGAEIAGNLTLSGGSIECPGDDALLLDRAVIRANLHLRRGFSAVGAVRMVGASIGGDLDCTTGMFANPSHEALLLDRARIDGNVLFEGTKQAFTAKGAVRLVGARIGGEFEAGNVRFHCAEPDEVAGDALVADSALIGGSLVLTPNFRADGAVRLRGVKVGQELNCWRGQVRAQGVALDAENAQFGGNLLLGVPNEEITPRWKRQPNVWAFAAEGGVRLFGAVIGGNAVFHLARLTGSGINNVALDLENAKIAGGLMLREGFQAEGMVRLFATSIAGDMDCAGGSFMHQPMALAVWRSQIGGSVMLTHAFRPKGGVTFRGVGIGKDLSLYCADLEPAAGHAIRFIGLDIKGELCLEAFSMAELALVELLDTSCAVLRDRGVKWPRRLALDEFAYRTVDPVGSVRERLDWLRRGLPIKRTERVGAFRPQPYRQLASVLRAQGNVEEARDVLIGMAVDRRRWAALPPTARAWQLLLWAWTRNGFRPLYALVPLGIWWLVGFLMFGLGYQAHIMRPLDRAAAEAFAQEGRVGDGYESFCALAYAVDSSLPIVSFGQRERWHVAVPVKPDQGDAKLHGPVNSPPEADCNRHLRPVESATP